MKHKFNFIVLKSLVYYPVVISDYSCDGFFLPNLESFEFIPILANKNHESGQTFHEVSLPKFDLSICLLRVYLNLLERDCNI